MPHEVSQASLDALRQRTSERLERDRIEREGGDARAVERSDGVARLHPTVRDRERVVNHAVTVAAITPHVVDDGLID